MTRYVLGVDPGSRGTGLALVDLDTEDPTVPMPLYAPHLLTSCTVSPDEAPPHAHRVILDPAYLNRVAAEVLEAARTCDGPFRVIIEGVVPPNPHVNRKNAKATTNVTPMLHTAAVFGVVLHRATSAGLDVAVVWPGKNGSGFLGTYPAALVSPSERRAAAWERQVAGRGKLKDARSAYDLTRNMHTRLPRRQHGVYQ